MTGRSILYTRAHRAVHKPGRCRARSVASMQLSDLIRFFRPVQNLTRAHWIAGSGGACVLAPAFSTKLSTESGDNWCFLLRVSHLCVANGDAAGCSRSRRWGRSGQGRRRPGENLVPKRDQAACPPTGVTVLRRQVVDWQASCYRERPLRRRVGGDRTRPRPRSFTDLSTGRWRSFGHGALSRCSETGPARPNRVTARVRPGPEAAAFCTSIRVTLREAAGTRSVGCGTVSYCSAGV